MSQFKFPQRALFTVGDSSHMNSSAIQPTMGQVVGVGRFGVCVCVCMCAVSLYKPVQVHCMLPRQLVTHDIAAITYHIDSTIQSIPDEQNQSYIFFFLEVLRIDNIFENCQETFRLCVCPVSSCFLIHETPHRTLPHRL